MNKLVSCDVYNLTADYLVYESEKVVAILVDSCGYVMEEEVEVTQVIVTVDLVEEALRHDGISMLRELLDWRDMVLGLDIEPVNVSAQLSDYLMSREQILDDIADLVADLDLEG